MWLQVEMAGSSIFDYVHQQDHPELAEHLGLGLPQGMFLSASWSVAAVLGVLVVVVVVLVAKTCKNNNTIFPV